MYSIDYSNRFKKDVKRCVKRGLDIQLLSRAVAFLAESGELPQTYNAHKLVGKYEGLWECHIQPDWLMVWQQNDTECILLFLETGTHSDIFG